MADANLRNEAPPRRRGLLCRGPRRQRSLLSWNHELNLSRISDANYLKRLFYKKADNTLKLGRPKGVISGK